jgi:hypothetical protein
VAVELLNRRRSDLGGHPVGLRIGSLPVSARAAAKRRLAACLNQRAQSDPLPGISHSSMGLAGARMSPSHIMLGSWWLPFIDRAAARVSRGRSRRRQARATAWHWSL